MAEVTLQELETLRQELPEPAKDLKINLTNVMKSEVLSAEQIGSVALASAYYIGNQQLLKAVLADVKAAEVSEAYLQDAKAASALMGMNTVFYRFRHLVGKEEYGQKPARLRMQGMLRPQTSKADFELMSLAVAALAGCETCIRAHEKGLREQGLNEDHVHEVVRIAAVLQGMAIALNDPR